MAGGCQSCQRRADAIGRLLRRLAYVVESRDRAGLALIVAAVLAGHLITFGAGYAAGKADD